jgi:hypothetical protein
MAYSIDPNVIEVALFGDFQPTGIAVSKHERKFVCFPRWSPEHTAPQVAELGADGALTPYPDARWNSWQDGESPKDKFVCVQSVYVDPWDRLWILEPGAVYFGPVVPGAPKLHQVDLVSNKIVKTIYFDEKVAPLNSYLNDVRLNEKGTHAYITDSNLGHLVVVDLERGVTRVVLDSHPAMKAEKDVVPTVEGIETRLPDGSVFQVHCDGIAVTGGYCYVHAVTGRIMYRIKTDLLDDPSLSDAELGKHVEKVGETGIPDGLFGCADGDVVMTALEKNGLDLLRAGKVIPVCSDARIQWPDSVAVQGDWIYVTASQVHRMPLFNGNVDKRERPYGLYKVKKPKLSA